MEIELNIHIACSGCLKAVGSFKQTKFQKNRTSSPLQRAELTDGFFVCFLPMFQTKLVHWKSLPASSV